MLNMREHGLTGITLYNHCELPDDPKAKAAVAKVQKLSEEIRQRFHPDAFSDMAGGYI